MDNVSCFFGHIKSFRHFLPKQRNYGNLLKELDNTIYAYKGIRDIKDEDEKR